MVVFKGQELKTGKPSLLSNLGRGTDHFFHNIFNIVGNILSSFNKHTFIAIAQWLAFHVLLRIRNVYVEIKDRFLSNPHGKKLIDAVRGRGEVTNHGASFYLRRISEK